ncbi:hypothetical protein BKA62DRAFT_774671 [Auriculariales sp. MPI-PUGE-AT-0066]|nr:hypothetical protein BKA62DRAFT_774671 [Auriculariales sp. MPI-PUGE-AT-0066]
MPYKPQFQACRLQRASPAPVEFYLHVPGVHLAVVDASPPSSITSRSDVDSNFQPELGDLEAQEEEFNAADDNTPDEKEDQDGGIATEDEEDANDEGLMEGVEEAYAAWSVQPVVAGRKRKLSKILDGVPAVNPRNAQILARLNQQRRAIAEAQAEIASRASSVSKGASSRHSRLLTLAPAMLVLCIRMDPSPRRVPVAASGRLRVLTATKCPLVWEAHNHHLARAAYSHYLIQAVSNHRLVQESGSVNLPSRPASLQHCGVPHGQHAHTSTLAAPSGHLRPPRLQATSHASSLHLASPVPSASPSLEVGAANGEVPQDNDDDIQHIITPQLLDGKPDNLLGSYFGSTYTAITMATLAFNTRILVVNAFPGPLAATWIDELWQAQMEFATPRIELTTGIRAYITTQQSSFRTRDKVSIEKDVRAAYNLGGSGLINRVSMILDGNIFIYSSWTSRAAPQVTVPFTQQRGIGRPYKHPALMVVIKQIAFSRSVSQEHPWICDLMPDAFLADDGQAKRLPLPLYAFAATLINFALDNIKAEAEYAAAAAAANTRPNKTRGDFGSYRGMYQTWLAHARKHFEPTDNPEKREKMDQLRREHWCELDRLYHLESAADGPDRDEEALSTGDEGQ